MKYSIPVTALMVLSTAAAATAAPAQTVEARMAIENDLEVNVPTKGTSLDLSQLSDSIQGVNLSDQSRLVYKQMGSFIVLKPIEALDFPGTIPSEDGRAVLRVFLQSGRLLQFDVGRGSGTQSTRINLVPDTYGGEPDVPEEAPNPSIPANIPTTTTAAPPSSPPINQPLIAQLQTEVVEIPAEGAESEPTAEDEGTIQADTNSSEEEPSLDEEPTESTEAEPPTKALQGESSTVPVEEAPEVVEPEPPVEAEETTQADTDPAGEEPALNIETPLLEPEAQEEEPAETAPDEGQAVESSVKEPDSSQSTSFTTNPLQANVEIKNGQFVVPTLPSSPSEASASVEQPDVGEEEPAPQTVATKPVKTAPQTTAEEPIPPAAPSSVEPERSEVGGQPQPKEALPNDEQNSSEESSAAVSIDNTESISERNHNGLANAIVRGLLTAHHRGELRYRTRNYWKAQSGVRLLRRNPAITLAEVSKRSGLDIQVYENLLKMGRIQ